MTARVTDYLPLLSSAPNGVLKLRELLRELAVRGHLVPQLPDEESAGNLLMRAAKGRENERGKSKTSRPSHDASDVESPFITPIGWAFAPLKVVATLITKGTTPTTLGFPYTDAGIRFVKVESIRDGRIDPLLGRSYISADADAAMARSRLAAGDVLFSIAGTIGKTCVVYEEDLPANTNQALAIIRGTGSIFSLHFLKLQLDSFVAEKTRQRARGGAMPNVSLGDLNELVVVVPPFDEQHRIVAKFNELMALCDRLEAEQADAETAHAQLVQALLASLTQARDAADFRANWQQLTEHFHTLFTTEASIDALKQVVLQLGVMGKLVPQLSSDEPASALLDRATQARQLQAKPGRSAKPSQASEVSNAEMLFDLPAGWVWTRKANVLHFLNGYAFKSEWFKPEGTRLLRNVNVGHGSIDWKECASIPSDQAAEFSEFELQVNDLVLTLDRPIISTGLKAAIVKETDLPCLLLQRVAKISSFADCIATSYLFIWLNSRFFTGSIDPGRSNGVPHISTTQVAKMAFALPPLAEQHRIVAKVDELLALCDQLKLDLTQARQHHTHLASVLVDQAVAA